MREKTGKAVTRRDILNINSSLKKRQSVGIIPKKPISILRTKVGTSDPVFRGKAALQEDVAEENTYIIIRHETESTCPQSDNDESEGSDFDVPEPGFDAGQWLNDNFEDDDASDHDIQVNFYIDVNLFACNALNVSVCNDCLSLDDPILTVIILF